MYSKSIYKNKLNHFLTIVLMSLLMLTFNTKTFADEETLSYPFNADSGRYWQYVSDRVMGGVSDGQVALEQDGEMYYARLTGNVSTANNGGFIQLRASVSLQTQKKREKTSKVFVSM